MREEFNLNFENPKIAEVLYKIAISQLFSSVFVEETEILLRNNEVSIKPEYYFPEENDEIYLYSKIDGMSKLKLKI
jgi:hypothetical protein